MGQIEWIPSYHSVCTQPGGLTPGTPQARPFGLGLGIHASHGFLSDHQAVPSRQVQIQSDPLPGIGKIELAPQVVYA